MPISQKDSVINATKEVLGSLPNVPVKEVLTKDQLIQIRSKVTDGIIKGEVVYSKDISNKEDVLKYVRGMVDNHLRKAKELNGGVKLDKTEAKPKKVKVDSKEDPQLKEMKKLAESLKDPVKVTMVNEAIKERESQLRAKTSSKRVSPAKIEETIIPEIE